VSSRSLIQAGMLRGSEVVVVMAPNWLFVGMLFSLAQKFR